VLVCVEARTRLGVSENELVLLETQKVEERQILRVSFEID
jgi:hypothetical protein